MSPLPQRKKSPEEIAKLREGLGIPGDAAETTSPAPDAAPKPAKTKPASASKRAPKPVRSLRKSEQAPLPAAPHEPPPDTPLPFHRHTDQELQDIRLNAALAMPTPVVNPKLAVAHPGLIIPGYLLAIAAAATPFSDQIPMPVPAICAVAALIIAGFIFLKPPLSRHPAGFIVVATLFIIVFAALHYFPHLRHAT